MLTLWMFGVDLERQWGTRFFARYYFISGIGAAVTTLLVSLLPFDFAANLRGVVTVGASGAIYGLLVAFAMTYPHRPILVFLLFPLPARLAVLLFGAIAFYMSIAEPLGGVAHATHLGGLVAGYLYLAGRRGHVLSTLRSQWLRWRLARMRRRFDVHEGGRKGPGGPWVH
jgi:membrane associated rhomboid family serine protease